jgi:hypothetical protein
MKDDKSSKRKHLEHEAEGAGMAAVAGAALGSIAGPPGAIAGALVGAAMGAASASVMEKNIATTSDDEKKLDDEIGVTKGELGAPNLKHPPAKVGAYSGASAGATSSTPSPTEGPMPTPDDDD